MGVQHDIKVRTLSPAEWLNRCSGAWGVVVEKYLDCLPGGASDRVLIKDLSERFERFDAELGSATPPGLDRSSITAIRTTLGSLKKFRCLEGDTDSLSRAAMDRFEANNSASADHRIPARFVGLMQSIIQRWLLSYADARSAAIPRFGPGAVAEKFSIQDRWDHLFSSNAVDYDPVYPDDVNSVADRLSPERSVCRLCAVPKDWNKMRLITVEPYANTFLQHYVRHSLLSALRAGGPGDLRRLADPSRVDPQMYHRRLAQSGSVDGSLATLDLSDASDSISWSQVTQVFPALVLADIERSRSISFRRPSGTPHDMHMYAGMGNATTFTVETMMFHAACRAIALYHRIPLKDAYVSVFGDDIVVSAPLADVIIRNHIFCDFGWTINESKSFYDPRTRFRESCGIQAFKGQDVTLFRYHGYSSGLGGIVSAIDNIRSCCTNLDWIELVQQPWNEVNVPNCSDISCPGALITSVPWWPDTFERTRRFNRSYWRDEVRVFVPRIPRVSCPYTGLGSVYGALSGQLRWKTGVGRVHGRKVVGLLHEAPNLARAVPKYVAYSRTPWMPI